MGVMSWNVGLMILPQSLNTTENPSSDYLFPPVNKQRSINRSVHSSSLPECAPPVMKHGRLPTERDLGKRIDSVF